MPDLPNPDAPKQIRFHQIKSNLFRVIYADGIWGCVHPSDMLHLTFYNERAPIAREVVMNINPNDTLGSEDVAKRISKEGYIREMEIDIVLRRDVARSLHQWLGAYLEGTLQAPPAEFE